MAKGKVKRVANLDRKFGASESYLFVKIEASWSSDTEEYLLMTNNEVKNAVNRAAANLEDLPRNLSRGVFSRVDNNNKHARADDYYVYFQASLNGEDVYLMFTEEEMDRIRARVAKNQEDIEANKTSWLADLFD